MLGQLAQQSAFLQVPKQVQKLKFASYFSHPCHVDDSGFVMKNIYVYLPDMVIIWLLL